MDSSPSSKRPKLSANQIGSVKLRRGNLKKKSARNVRALMQTGYLVSTNAPTER
jgi:hypothetical protein